MSQHRDQHDFLGWAPAEPLEWQPEPSSWGQRPTAPTAPRAPQSTHAEAAPTPGGRPNQSRQSAAPRAQTPHAPQAMAPAKALMAAPLTSANQTQQRSGRPAAPLFGVAALAFGFLLIFTLMTLAGTATGGTGLGPVPLFAGIATFMVGRAAWAMRPRAGS